MINPISITPAFEPLVLNYYPFDEIVGYIPNYCWVADGYVKYPDGDIYDGNHAINGLYRQVEDLSQTVNALAGIGQTPSIDLTQYGVMPSCFTGLFTRLVSQHLGDLSQTNITQQGKYGVAVSTLVTKTTEIIPIDQVEITSFSVEVECFNSTSDSASFH